MDLRKCEEFGYVLDIIHRVKMLYDAGDDEAVEVMGNCTLGEEFEFEGYEHLCDAAPFSSVDYVEKYECEKYFFASEDMTEYYRLARKIGGLKGWSVKNNRYIQQAIQYDINTLRSVNGDGYISGTIYSKTHHKYASSWVIYVYSEFYNYWELFFALRDIFNNYSMQKKVLECEYRKLICEQCNQEMEAAA